MATLWSHHDNPDYRDDAERHQRMLLERGVPPELDAQWQAINDQIITRPHRHKLSRSDLAAAESIYPFDGEPCGIPCPPIWVYQPYGILRETPCLPGTPGFYERPYTPDDVEEAWLEINHPFR